MSFSYHLCPVCDAPDIRKSVKTCGSKRCLTQWKGWNDVYRMKRMLRANMGSSERFKHDIEEQRPDGFHEVSAEDLTEMEASEPKPNTAADRWTAIQAAQKGSTNED